jgi:hypothetical protein
VDTTAQHDTPLGGWHAVWLGAAFDREGDKDSALISYGHAMRRLGGSMALPRPGGGRVEKNQGPQLNAFGRSLQGLLSYTHGNKFEAELAKLSKTVAVIDEGDPRSGCACLANCSASLPRARTTMRAPVLTCCGETRRSRAISASS